MTCCDVHYGKKIIKNLLKIISNVKIGWLSAQKRAASTEISVRNSPMLIFNIPAIRRKSVSTPEVEETSTERNTFRVSENFE